MKWSVATLVLLLILRPSATRADLIAGLSIHELAPPEFSSSTVLSIASDPAGTVWYSNGDALFFAPADGSPGGSESLRGPLAASSVTTSIAFDTAGRTYINDFSAGVIYRRESVPGPWSVFASGMPFPRAMKFDQGGRLIVASGDIVSSAASTLYAVSPQGAVSILAAGLNNVEAFDFDAQGNIVFPDYIRGDIYRVHPGTGAVVLVGNGLSAPGPSVVEAFAITAGGHMLLGVNAGACTGQSCAFQGNTNRLDRYDPALGASIVLGTNYTSLGQLGYRLPVDFELRRGDGSLLMATFGSIQPMRLTGNLDADPAASVPESPPPAGTSESGGGGGIDVLSLLLLGFLGLLRQVTAPKTRSEPDREL